MGFLDNIELEEESKDGSEDGVASVLDHYGDDAIDATDSIVEYDKGKTVKCECGAKIGIEMNRVAVRCYTCEERVLVDTRAVDRPIEDKKDYEHEEDTDESQTGLDDWM